MPTRQEIPKKLTTMAITVMVVFGFLMFRLFSLQVIGGKKFERLSEGNRIRIIPVAAPRGNIVDRYGLTLAGNRTSLAISVIPLSVKNPEREYPEMERLLSLPEGYISTLVNQQGRRPYQPVRLAENPPVWAVSYIEERRESLPGIVVEEIPVRDYPAARFAAHILGYTGLPSSDELKRMSGSGLMAGEPVGKSGLEKEYEGFLKGRNGGLQVEVDNLGHPVGYLGSKAAVPGSDLVLSIDLAVQMAAQQALEEQMNILRGVGVGNVGAGAVVALDVRTGAIRAMVSEPSFDPNLFAKGLTGTELGKLLENPLNPFTNRALAGEYPIGSTFKPITGIAALEEGKTGKEDSFYCWGRDPQYPQKKCWILAKGKFHGRQNLVEGYKNSCNIVFYELGRRVGADALAAWSRNFGFGQRTGVDLSGEKSGIVPDKAWKKKAIGQRWYPIETLDFSIGQGFFTATPIQLARAYCAIANGGKLVTPYIVESVVDYKGKAIKKFRPEKGKRIKVGKGSLATIREGLKAVTSPGGTAAGAFYGSVVPVAGKTGTAQNSQGADHGWFAGFAPADDPELAVVVLVEHGGSGSGAAAPVARKVFGAYFRDRGPFPVYRPKAQPKGASGLISAPAPNPSVSIGGGVPADPVLP